MPKSSQCWLFYCITVPFLFILKIALPLPKNTVVIGLLIAIGLLMLHNRLEAQSIFIYDANKTLKDSIIPSNTIVFKGYNSSTYHYGKVLHINDDFLVLEDDSMIVLSKQEHIKKVNRTNYLLYIATESGIRLGYFVQNWCSLAVGLGTGISLYQPNVSLVYLAQRSILSYSVVHFTGYVLKVVSRSL